MKITARATVLGSVARASAPTEVMRERTTHETAPFDLVNGAEIPEINGGCWEPAETVTATIPVGAAAGDIAVADSDHVYVATAKSVAVLNSSNHIVGGFPLPGEARHIAINGDGTRVYVTTYDGIATIIDTADGTLRTHLLECVDAEAISPDGAYLYTAANAVIGGRHRSLITVSNGDSTTLAAVPVEDHVRDLVVSPDGSRLYVATSVKEFHYQYDPGCVRLIDTATFDLVDTIQVGVSPSTITASPDGSHIYVGHYDAACISAIDLATRTVSEIALEDSPLGVSVTPDSGHVYVTNRDSLAVIDATTNGAETVSTGALPRRLQFSPDGKRAYVTNFGDQTISVIDTITNCVAATFELDGHPEAIAMSPDGGRLYVSDYWSGTVTVVSIPSVNDRDAE